MLGLTESFSEPDLDLTRKAITLAVEDHNIPTESCVDVACGIGRVAVNVLSDFCKRVDLVDPMERFIAMTEEELTGIGITVDKYVIGAQLWLQKFVLICLFVLKPG
jgi:ubiquinone/menaquinone biosynthesis C-methylase UbiE